LELWKDIMDFVEVAWVMRTRSCELGLYWVSRPSLRRANHSRPHESQATHPGSTSQSRGRKHHKSKEVDSPWGRPHLTFQIYKLELERSKQGEQDRLDRRQSQTDTPEGIGITLSAKLTAFSQCSLSACARAHPEGRHIPIRSGNTDCRFRLV